MSKCLHAKETGKANCSTCLAVKIATMVCRKCRKQPVYVFEERAVPTEFCEEHWRESLNVTLQRHYATALKKNKFMRECGDLRAEIRQLRRENDRLRKERNEAQEESDDLRKELKRLRDEQVFIPVPSQYWQASPEIEALLTRGKRLESERSGKRFRYFDQRNDQ